MKHKIIAVDFDGTLCENAWPEIGEARPMVIEYIREQKKCGAKIILWTNRSGECLKEAVAWCELNGITFDAVNENIPESIKQFGNDCRKVYADEYIDDRAVPIPGIPADLSTEMGRALYFVRERLGKREILAQLAEEASELAQAALKYRRALDGKNPTPMNVLEASGNLVEEIADVELCVSLLQVPEDDRRKTEIKRYKSERWMNRLRKSILDE